MDRVCLTWLIQEGYSTANRRLPTTAQEGLALRSSSPSALLLEAARRTEGWMDPVGDMVRGTGGISHPSPSWVGKRMWCEVDDQNLTITTVAI